MQFHEHLGEVQAHARSRVRVIRVDLDEALEHPADVAVLDLAAGVEDGDLHVFLDVRPQEAAVGKGIGDGQMDPAAFRRVLEGVREDVVDDLVEVSLVDPQELLFLGGIDREMDVFRFRQGEEGLHDVLDEIHQVRPPEVHRHLPRIDLPEVHQLVDQSVDTKAVTVHQVVGVLLGGILLGFAQRAQRSHHERERGADLVREVGEKAEAEFLQFGVLHLLLALFPPPPQAVKGVADGRKQQQIRGIGPSGPVPRRLHLNVDAPHGILLRHPFEIGLDLEGIASGRHIGIGGGPMAGRDGLPVGVEPAQPAGVGDAHGVGVLRDGEGQGEQVGARRNQDAGGFRDVLVDEVGAAQVGIVFDVLLQLPQAREEDLRDLVPAAVDKTGREGRHAACAAEIQQAGRGPGGGAGPEFVALEAVGGMEGSDDARPGIEPGQAARRRNPEISRLGGDDVADDVVGESVAFVVLPEYRAVRVRAEQAVAGAEPDGPFLVAGDGIDSRPSVFGPEQDDLAGLHLVLVRAVVGAHPQKSALVQMQSADPQVRFVDGRCDDP